MQVLSAAHEFVVRQPSSRLEFAHQLAEGQTSRFAEELVNARRESVFPTSHGDDDESVWQLSIVGKRNKQRMVPVNLVTIAALKAHWHHRGLDFETAKDGPAAIDVFRASDCLRPKKSTLMAPPSPATSTASTKWLTWQ